MYIRFDNLKLSNFMSFEDLDVKLDERGLILLKGINSQDSKCRSNGSGKSSILEAILWALTGSTSRGSKNPSNSILNQGCLVELILYVDTTSYIITRTKDHPEHKNSLTIIKDGEDISGRNLTSSNEVLKTELGELTTESLNSIVILSQGMPDKFSDKRPAARKEFLEKICNTDVIVSSLKSQLSNIESEILKSSSSISSKIDLITTMISNSEDRIDKLNSSITRYKSATKFTDDPDYLTLKSYDKDLSESISKLHEAKYELKSAESSIKSEYTTQQSRIRSLTRESDSNLTKLKSLESTENPTCPTCHQVIKDQDLVTDLIDHLQTAISNCSNSIQDLETALESKLKSLEVMGDNLGNINTALESKLDERSQLQSELKEYTRRDTTLLLDTNKSIEDEKSLILDNQRLIKDLKSDLEEYLQDTEVVKYLQSKLSREFRSYLLRGVIDYLNSKLDEYSTYLFEDRVVTMEVNSNNLDILLGGRDYEVLSGGERRRVDLMLQIALRDLYITQTGVRFNLLALDEVLDNLDTAGINSVMDLLRMKSPDVSTTIMISHMDVPLPTDDTWVVRKDPSGVSSMED